MYKNILLALLLSASVLSFAAEAPPKPAQGQPVARGGGIVAMMDANKDGKVTKDELLSWFEKSDTNKDGILSSDEIRVAQEAYRASLGLGQGRGPGGQGRGPAARQQ